MISIVAPPASVPSARLTLLLLLLP